MGWDDPEFVSSVKRYNRALETYRAFQATRQDRASLAGIEQQCRDAIAGFQACRARAPDSINLDRLVSDCYQLISDVRQSSHVSDR